jgi:hypothetical protein
VGHLHAAGRDRQTIVFTVPRYARAFFEALAADNLDIGRPDNIEIIFNRQFRTTTHGVFRTAIDRENDGIVVNAATDTAESSTTSRTAA